MMPILSTDPDSATLTYSLTDELGNTPTLFKLSADNRIVATGTPTDYEDTNAFVLTVSVSDGDLIATHDINVAILPVNETPVITTPTTNAVELDENSVEDTIVIDTATGVAMLPILSTDPDSATLTYSLTDELGNTPTLFKLSADNRIVATGTPTDYEDTNAFVLTVSVTDGDLIATHDINVAILPINETPIITTPVAQTVELDENSVEDTIVIDTATGVAMLPILSTDPDSATLTYSLTDELGNTPTLFKLSSDNRIVATGTPTDYEDTNAFVLTVSVSDGALIATHDISVAILPVNETPVITTPVTQTAQINENALEDTIVIDTATGVAMLPILSTDPDSATLTYSLTDELGNTPTLFKLSADNRIVATGTPTDYEDTNAFVLTVSVSDGALIATHDINVAILPVNESPVITTPVTQTAQINENSLEDTIVIDTATGVAMLPILSTDPDSANLIYSLTDELGNTPTLFKLSADNRIVATSTPTDYEDTNAFVLTVSVTDGEMIATHDISVAILPVNESPVITTPTTNAVELDENSVEDTIVIDTATGVAMLPILSTDPDSANLTYSLTDELGNTPTLFKLSADNRIVATGTPTDYEDTNAFVLTVSVSDGDLIATHDISVAILPVNETPVISTPVTQTAQINENALEDTIVIDTATGVAMLPILSTDPDSANLTYSLTDELGNTPTLFKLSADNRIVATGTPTDYEDTNAFVLTVSVSDGDLIATHDISVTILPVNETPVISTPVTQTAQINENALEDTIVIDTATGVAMLPILSTDPDSATLTYSLTDELGNTPALFKLSADNRIVATGTPTDYEDTNAFVLTVSVSDGDLIATHDISVTILPVNETPVISTPVTQTAQINENALEDTIVIDTATGAAMLPILSTDPDSANLTYSLTDELGNTPAFFKLSEDNRIVATGTPTDYEDTNAFVLTVSVSDGALIATHDISVAILPVNESPVISTPATNAVELDENSVENTIVIDTATGVAMLPILSTDPDSANLTYSLTDELGNTPTLFKLSADNRIVATGTPTDYETLNSISLKVTVTDGNLTAEQDVTVTILPVNEAPTANVPASVSIVENEQGLLPFLLNPIDPDGDTVPTVTVENLTNPLATSNDFEIIKNQFIRVENPLDHESDEVIKLLVNVSDGTLDTSYEIDVNVLDVNEAPTQEQIIDDQETPEAAQFSYQIPLDSFVDEDDDPLTIKVTMPNGSQITSTHWINYDEESHTLSGRPDDAAANLLPPVELLVSATDGPYSTPTQILKITVNDVNQAPTSVDLTSTTLSSNNGFLVVPEHTPDISIGNLSTSDPDVSDTVHSYVVIDDPAYDTNPRFIVDGNELKLSPTAQLDFNTERFVNINIISTDVNEATTSRDFTFIVGNINDAPVAPATLDIQTATDAQTFSYTIPPDSFTDADDDDTLSFTVAMANDEPLPNWLNFDSNNGVLSGTPTDADTNQQLNLHITANDGNADSESVASLIINVVDSNQQPYGIALDSNTVPELTPGAIVGNLTTSDPDSVDNNFTYTVDDARFEVDENGVLKVVSPEITDNESADLIDIDVEQTIRIAVTTSDGTEPGYTTFFDLEVINVNENPTIVSIPENPQVSAETAFQLSSISIIDAESPPEDLEITVVSSNLNELPGWLKFSPESNTLSIENAPADIEGYEIAIIVNDPNGGTTIERVYINISRAPIVAAAEPEPTPEPENTLEVASAPELTMETLVAEQASNEEEMAETTETEDELKLISSKDDETIDLAALIKPLETVNLVDIQTVDNSIKSIDKALNLIDTNALDSIGNLLDLSAAFNQPSDIEFGDLASEFDRQREQLAKQAASTQTLIGSSFTISSGLSVGYLLWLVRGGTLMGSVLSSLPAWRLVDPLPILGSLGDDLEDDDESLESMVDSDKAPKGDVPPAAKAA